MSNSQTEIKTAEDFLDSIENEKLYRILVTADRLTLWSFPSAIGLEDKILSPSFPLYGENGIAL